MLKLLKRQANKTYTENGAVTFRTSFSNCLDLFARIGALRNASEEAIISAFAAAYFEDADLAMKILFFARDIRGGLGERRVFRVIMRWLAVYHRKSVTRNLARIAEYGRFDDVVELIYTPCRDAAFALIKEQLKADMTALRRGESVSLLAKWLPSVNASNAETVRKAKTIAKALGMSEAQYRKALSGLRAKIRIIENSLREKDYSFDYGKQPSRAMFKYRGAFLRNDHDRYLAFLDWVSRGEVKLHTGALMPYDIIRQVIDGDCAWNGAFDSDEDKRKAMDVSWNALEDFTDGSDSLVVVDGSGSMYGGGNPLPITVALSLGIYFAERNTGAFKGHFITFSESPQLVEIKGEDIVDKTIYCEQYDEVANTNLQKVFELLLETAVENDLSQEDLPETLYIISDMEFDYCVNGADETNFEHARRLFKAFGYRLPQVVFWNVQSRNVQVPVTMNEQGVVLVSGCTPRLFSMIAKGEYSPFEMMMEIIGGDRYASIAA